MRIDREDLEEQIRVLDREVAEFRQAGEAGGDD